MLFPPLRVLASGLALALLLPGCTYWRMFTRLKPRANDYLHQPVYTLAPSLTPFRFIEPSGPPAWQHLLDTLTVHTFHRQGQLPEVLPESGSLTLLVFQHDTLKYEAGWCGPTDSLTVTTFSVAKALVATCVGIAIQEGKIQSIEQPVTDFLPELRNRGFKDVRIRHLLNMCSDLKLGRQRFFFVWESGKLYYSSNLKRLMLKRKDAGKPGPFRYLNSNTELLGLILERATGKPLAQYVDEKLWQPIGAEKPMFWAADHPGGLPRAFCCMNGMARDFAKYGRLYAHQGSAQGRQIVDSAWVARSFGDVPDSCGRPGYRLHWLLRHKSEGWYFCSGLYGQYIAIVPEKDIILVHFSRKNNLTDPEWSSLLSQIVGALPPMRQKD